MELLDALPVTYPNYAFPGVDQRRGCGPNNIDPAFDYIKCTSSAGILPYHFSLQTTPPQCEQLFQRPDPPGTVIANFIKSRVTGTDQLCRRSMQSRYSVSISIVEKLFNVSEKTAYNYKKLAEKSRFIKIEQNLREVELSPKDITHLKQNEIQQIRLQLFGSTGSISVHPKQLRTDKGHVYAQLPNFITPFVIIGKRKM